MVKKKEGIVDRGDSGAVAGCSAVAGKAGVEEREKMGHRLVWGAGAGAVGVGRRTSAMLHSRDITCQW